ncbi:hypothetical protein MTO96_028720, partial [Rhipicephalus appendiculatus]
MPTELVVIVVVALIPHAQGQIYCLKEYKISPNHTGCKNANNITTVPAYGLQSFYNDVLLQLFNSYRSSVAVGNCKPFPSAANMLKLEWDNELATLAYLHSAFLINASNWPLHDEVENRFTTRFKETGQSVAVLHNTTHRYVSYWNTVIREWFAEYQLLKLAAVGSYDADESTTNVSQMWWATTKYVGCGYSTMLMPNGHDFDHAYVCNFGPAGNVRGHAIYRQGATCSAWRVSQGDEMGRFTQLDQLNNVLGFSGLEVAILGMRFKDNIGRFGLQCIAAPARCSIQIDGEIIKTLSLNSKGDLDRKVYTRRNVKPGDAFGISLRCLYNNVEQFQSFFYDANIGSGNVSYK